MPLTVELSIVATSVAFIILAVVATRSMLRFDRAVERVTERFSRTSEGVNQALLEVAKVTAEMKEVVGALRDTAPHVRRLTERFEKLGDRILGISNAVVDEVEQPVRSAVAIARGVRSGTSYLMQLISRRLNGAAPKKEMHYE